MKWFLKCIRNYVNFAGRAQRKEFWFFNLFVFIFTFVASVLDYMLFSMAVVESVFLQSLVSLVFFLPSLTVAVRRLHDTGRSGVHMLLYLIGLLFFVGISFIILYAWGFLVYGGVDREMPLSLDIVFSCLTIAMLAWTVVLTVWFCTNGDKGDNKYGPDPKETQE